MSHLKLLLLGAPQVESDNTPCEFETRKALALLAYLAVTNQTHSRDALATLFWPEQDQTQARTALRYALWALQKGLGKRWFQVEREHIGLTLSNDFYLDVKHFQAQLVACRTHGHAADEVCPACLPLLNAAVALYRGDFLAGFTLRDSPGFDDWQFFQAESLRQDVAAALERLVRGHSAQGEYAQAIPSARRWLALDPLHEPAQRQLMQVYAQAGQQAAALRQYQECVRILDEEMGAPPEAETTALYEQIRAGAFSDKAKGRQSEIFPVPQPSLIPASSLAPARGYNLPTPLTAFIGRQREIAEVQHLLTTTRLLTLTGAGGCGKTRLALQVARINAERNKTVIPDSELNVLHFSDGICWVELAALTDATLVAQTVATALGVHEQPGRPLLETLVDALHSKNLLLVLDNCEHLVDVCAQVAESLLYAAPGLQILTTSREVLGVAGEVTWRVPGLTRPKLTTPAPYAQLLELDAVRLFVERAATAMPDFALTAQNASAVVQICQRLDGLPLALELAAARVKMLTVEQIAQRLDDRFRLLTTGSRTAPARQQTLRATIDWSYALLTAPEETLWRRLAVFVGGFTLEAVEAITEKLPFTIDDCDTTSVRGAEEDERSFANRQSKIVNPLDLLSRLVDKSLVVVDPPARGNVRYRLLETMREYAAARLAEGEEITQVQQRHTHFYLALAEQAEPMLRAAEQIVWFEQLELEYANLRAALVWSQAAPARHELGLRLAGALWSFWSIRSHFQEGQQWLEGLLAGSAAVADAVRVKALLGAGELAWMRGDYASAAGWYEQALACARTADDQRSIAWAINGLGVVAQQQGDYGRAAAAYQESLTRFQTVGDRRGIAWALDLLGDVALFEGDYARAQALYTESLALGRELGDRERIAITLGDLGNLALDQGDYAQAMTRFQERLTIAREVGDQTGLCTALRQLGRTAQAQGDYAAAGTLFLESLTLTQQFGDKWGDANALYELGLVAKQQGDYPTARTRFEQALPLFQDFGNQWFIALVLNCLGVVAQYQGDNRRAIALCCEGLKLYWEQQDLRDLAWSLVQLAEVTSLQAQPERAACLLGVAMALREAVGVPLSLAARPNYERTVATVRAQLSEEAFTTACAAGRVMTAAQAVDYALTIADDIKT